MRQLHVSCCSHGLHYSADANASSDRCTKDDAEQLRKAAPPVRKPFGDSASAAARKLPAAQLTRMPRPPKWRAVSSAHRAQSLAFRTSPCRQSLIDLTRVGQRQTLDQGAYVSLWHGGHVLGCRLAADPCTCHGWGQKQCTIASHCKDPPLSGDATRHIEAAMISGLD